MDSIRALVGLALLVSCLSWRADAGERVRVEIEGLPPVAVGTGVREDLDQARFLAPARHAPWVEVPTVQPASVPSPDQQAPLPVEIRHRTPPLFAGLELEDLSAPGDLQEAPPSDFREDLRGQGLDPEGSAARIVWLLYRQEPSALGDGVRVENAVAQVLGSELTPEEAERVRVLAAAPAEIEVRARRSLHLRSEPWSEAVLAVPSGAELETRGVGDGLQGWIQVQEAGGGVQGWVPAMWLETGIGAR